MFKKLVNLIKSFLPVYYQVWVIRKTIDGSVSVTPLQFNISDNISSQELVFQSKRIWGVLNGVKNAHQWEDEFLEVQYKGRTKKSLQGTYPEKQIIGVRYFPVTDIVLK